MRSGREGNPKRVKWRNAERQSPTGKRRKDTEQADGGRERSRKRERMKDGKEKEAQAVAAGKTERQRNGTDGITEPTHEGEEWERK